jgi:glucosylglycerate phosphorylase
MYCLDGMTKNELLNQIHQRLEFLYPEYPGLLDKLKEMMDNYSNNPIIMRKKVKYGDSPKLTQKDIFLITYGDSIRQKKEKSLKTLYRFLKKHVKNSITGVHLLPIFPYSSDYGFSIIDFKKVNSELGDWKDVKKIGSDYKLMIDLVINHVSSESEWFKKFLAGDKKYSNYFISFDKVVNTSTVFRPRTHPLLTKYKTKEGVKYVWTTFSEDQIDLNFRCPELFLDIVDILLFYLSQGVEAIRLDAIGFIWKELGTSCIHLKQTHEFVKLMRNICEYVAPYSIIITETNVPFKENISYFGEGDEAHMVYQFSLPPLVLDAMLRSDTRYLQELFIKISDLPDYSLFFNFLASHDGIGVLAGKEVLSVYEFNSLLNEVKKHKGLIGYKSTINGDKSPYELNINYLDAINNPNKKDKNDISRFLASQSVILSCKGVPGIYIHSLLGSRNYYKGVKIDKNNRTINREKLNYNILDKQLLNKNSFRKKVFEGYKKLIFERQKNKSFEPYTKECLIQSDKRLLIFKRDNITVVINFSDQKVPYSALLGMEDLLSKAKFDGIVKPYGVYFIK